MAEWGYSRNNGPSTWCNVAEAAKGSRQSPIDITNAKYDAGLAASPFSLTYVPAHSKTVTNGGKSITVGIDSSGSSLTGGPLTDKHQIVQFHFHWGKTSTTGSEHRINGQMYAAEGHLVHYNTAKFSSFGEAAKTEGGLCVLGVFLKAGAANPKFEKIVELCKTVPFAGDEKAVAGGFDPALLLPDDKSKYWTYSGSLTTPPCYESVTWVVFKEHIEVSEAQLNALRSLHSHKSGEACKDDFQGKIVENYRPPLALGSRTLRASFQ